MEKQHEQKCGLCLSPCSQVGQDGVRRALSLRACSYPRLSPWTSVTREFPTEIESVLSNLISIYPCFCAWFS